MSRKRELSNSLSFQELLADGSSYKESLSPEAQADIGEYLNVNKKYGTFIGNNIHRSTSKELITSEGEAVVRRAGQFVSLEEIAEDRNFDFEERRKDHYERSLKEGAYSNMDIAALLLAARKARELGDRTKLLNIEDEIQGCLIESAENHKWSSEEIDRRLSQVIDIIYGKKERSIEPLASADTESSSSVAVGSIDTPDDAYPTWPRSWGQTSTTAEDGRESSSSAAQAESSDDFVPLIFSPREKRERHSWKVLRRGIAIVALAAASIVGFVQDSDKEAGIATPSGNDRAMELEATPSADYGEGELFTIEPDIDESTEIRGSISNGREGESNSKEAGSSGVWVEVEAGSGFVNEIMQYTESQGVAVTAGEAEIIYKDLVSTLGVDNILLDAPIYSFTSDSPFDGQYGISLPGDYEFSSNALEIINDIVEARLDS